MRAGWWFAGLLVATLSGVGASGTGRAAAGHRKAGQGNVAVGKTVAVTIDDLPFVSGGEGVDAAGSGWAVNSNHKLLLELAKHHVPVTGLVNERTVEELGGSGPAILREWVSRGFDLGNHTYSHADFNDLTVAQFEKEVVRGEKSFKPLMETAHRKAEFFRFPFNHEGDTQEKRDAAIKFLKERGYRTAPCTIEDEDWVFNAAYFIANRKHDEIGAAKIRAAYLAYAAEEIDYFTVLNRQVLGYEPPHIIVLHDNPLNADVIGDVLALFEARGYTFVSLTEAERDPVYQNPDSYVTKYGMMWAYRWARERGVKVDGSKETEPPQWILDYAK